MDWWRERVAQEVEYNGRNKKGHQTGLYNSVVSSFLYQPFFVFLRDTLQLRSMDFLRHANIYPQNAAQKRSIPRYNIIPVVE